MPDSGVVVPEAIGGRTSATISNVLETSPAQRAGLKPGETVLVDIRRDGTTFQLTMPRGPLGIRGR